MKMESRWMKATIALTLTGFVSTMLFSCAGTTKESQSSLASSLTQTGESKTVDQKTFDGLKFAINDKLDLKGRTMVFSGWQVNPVEGKNEEWDRLLARRKKTMAKYNVVIKDVVSASDYDFVKDVVLAYSSGKKFADAIFAPSNFGISLLKVKGLAVPLNDYIDYSNPRFSYTATTSKFIDGQNYSYMPIDPGVGNLCYYNTTLLEAAGCEDIYELYKKGQWNWDKMLEIIKKTTIEKDGVVTQWGIGGGQLLDSLLASNGVTVITPDFANKKYTCGLYTDAGYNAMNALRKIAFEYKGTDGLYGGHNSIENFKQSKLAMIFAPLYYGGHFVSTGMTVMSAPLPKGPDAKGSVNMESYVEWNLVSSLKDFTTEEILQVAFDVMRNDPADEATYQPQFDTPSLKKDAFVTKAINNNFFTTEEESGFFYDFVNNPSTIKVSDLSNFEIQGILSTKIFGPIASGEDPRTYLTSVKPVIDQLLSDMQPK